jgi:hypothetical protein
MLVLLQKRVRKQNENNDTNVKSLRKYSIHKKVTEIEYRTSNRWNGKDQKNLGVR